MCALLIIELRAAEQYILRTAAAACKANEVNFCNDNYSSEAVAATIAAVIFAAEEDEAAVSYYKKQQYQQQHSQHQEAINRS